LWLNEPTNLVASAGNFHASVAFDVLANGGYAFLDFTVTASPTELTALAQQVR